MTQFALERARLRLQRLAREAKRPQEAPRLSTEERERKLAELVTIGGLTKVEMARELGVAPSTVQRDLDKPQVRQTLEELRAVVKRAILEESVKDVIGPAMEMARKKIAAGEAKEFDATMRGLNALEKTTQSASGEAQRIEADVRQVVLNRTEILARITDVIGQ